MSEPMAPAEREQALPTRDVERCDQCGELSTQLKTDAVGTWLWCRRDNWQLVQPRRRPL